MFQDVGHARGIRGRRAEAHAEAFVFVRVGHGEQLRARGPVPPEAGRAAHFRHVPFREQGEAVFVHVWVSLCLSSLSGPETGKHTIGMEHGFEKGPGRPCRLLLKHLYMRPDHTDGFPRHGGEFFHKFRRERSHIPEFKAYPAEFPQRVKPVVPDVGRRAAQRHFIGGKPSASYQSLTIS